MGGNTGDQWENIRENRKRAAVILGIEKIASVYQVHSDTVVHVSNRDSLDLGEADALCTQLSEVGLMIKHADCQAAIFYDPVNRALANVHAGWRGNVKNIYGKTLDRLKEAFGTSPRDLIVCISPSLGPSHAEFQNYREEFPEAFWKFQIVPQYFDLWALARSQLEERGVPTDQIEIASICTHANPQDFFSYRRDKITGRHATIAALRAC
jgi:YfiH family protein